MAAPSTGLWRAFLIVLVICVGYHLGVSARDLMHLLLLANFVIWLVALIGLLGRRDIDIHDKLSWVVAVLLLSGLGGLLYFAFGPQNPARQTPEPRPEDEGVPPDATPWDPDDRSWNPIFGVNALPPGAGLNPAADHDGQDTENLEPTGDDDEGR